MATPQEKVAQLNLTVDELSSYRRRFAALDLNKDGIVELREFVAVSKVFGYRLTKEEIYEIFDRTDLEESGNITFEDFVLAMYKRKQEAKKWAPYREKFWEYDTKNQGYITSDEAYPILHKDLGFDMNKTESLLDMYDKNKNYRLSLPEFIPFYHRVQELKKQLHLAFRNFDADGDGFINLEEASKALAPRGFSEDDIITTFYEYDKNGDDRWSFAEFAAFWNIPIF